MSGVTLEELERLAATQADPLKHWARRARACHLLAEHAQTTVEYHYWWGEYQRHARRIVEAIRALPDAPMPVPEGDAITKALRRKKPR